eukprot:jgi/Bigna1/81830/fgenesh1_pg.84_\
MGICWLGFFPRKEYIRRLLVVADFSARSKNVFYEGQIETLDEGYEIPDYSILYPKSSPYGRAPFPTTGIIGSRQNSGRVFRVCFRLSVCLKSANSSAKSKLPAKPSTLTNALDMAAIAEERPTTSDGKETKGGVSVVARFRPINKNEKEKGSK